MTRETMTKMLTKIEAEFEDFEKNNKWNNIYNNIKNESNKKNYSLKEAKKSENKILNRYKDVVPYDHSRVILQRCGTKYINASLIEVNSADREYILTQGPLPHTTGHFWLMVWERKTKAILMLNGVVESGRVKCHQYWPNGNDNDDTNELLLTDVNLKVEFLCETKHESYVFRKFLLIDIESGESREILHYHYTSWPDFGVPKSDSFIQYLFAVRQSGALDRHLHGPAVVHCSAGIGRSGTFCLVDSCLIMIEKSGSIDSVNIIDVLLDMRCYRMGLIQTAEQLRFSYQTIIQESKLLMSNANVNANLINNVPFYGYNKTDEIPQSPKIHRSLGYYDNPIQEDDDDDDDDDDNDEEEEDDDEHKSSVSPPLPVKNRPMNTSDCECDAEATCTKSASSVSHSISLIKDDALIIQNKSADEINLNENAVKEKELRKRNREEKRRKTNDTIERIKQKQRQSEERSNSKRKRRK